MQFIETFFIFCKHLPSHLSLDLNWHLICTLDTYLKFINKAFRAEASQNSKWIISTARPLDKMIKIIQIRGLQTHCTCIINPNQKKKKKLLTIPHNFFTSENFVHIILKKYLINNNDNKIFLFYIQIKQNI